MNFSKDEEIYSICITRIMFFERFCTVVYDGYAGNGLRAEGAQERYSTGADCHQAHAEWCRHLADTPREKHIREDAEGKCCFWSRKRGYDNGS